MKISIVGIGHVGATIAYTLLSAQVGRELVLINRTRQRAEGEAVDLCQAGSFLLKPPHVRAGDLSDAAGSDIIILALSEPVQVADRRQSLESNAKLYREVVPVLAAAAPQAVFIVVTNPVEPLTYYTLKLSGLANRQVLGAGTIIDSARFRTALSKKWKVHPDDLRAYVLGEHGDCQFPALSIASVGGVAVANRAEAQQLFQQAAQSSYLAFEQKGFTNCAIAQAVSLMVTSIADNQLRTMPVSTMIEGYLGARDVCLSLPCIVGRNGIEQILFPELDASESEAFVRAADTVRELHAKLPEC